ncbi:hypothetical protein [Kribbella sp. NPDC050470]|uniref:hypothetical protein n=1 Tax=unclassified Kribbella TaxID=2644121 RepID=UPI0037AB4A13
MTAIVRGIAWLGVFVGICVAPLVFALMSTSQPGQGFWAALVQVLLVDYYVDSIWNRCCGRS